MPFLLFPKCRRNKYHLWEWKVPFTCSLGMGMTFLGRTRYGLTQALGNSMIFALSYVSLGELRFSSGSRRVFRRGISTESRVKQSWSLKTLHRSHLKKGLEQQPRS